MTCDALVFQLATTVPCDTETPMMSTHIPPPGILHHESVNRLQGIIIPSGCHFHVFVFMLPGCRVGYWRGVGQQSAQLAIPIAQGRGMYSDADMEMALPFCFDSPQSHDAVRLCILKREGYPHLVTPNTRCRCHSRSSTTSRVLTR